jgi:nitrogen fixation protein FixH
MKLLVDSLMKIFFTLIIAATVVMIFLSCNSGNNQLAYLENADELTIQFFKPKDTVVLTTRKRGQIDILAETVIDGGGELVNLQDTTGRMLFTQKDSLLLEVYFSTPNTGSKFTAPVFAFGQDQHVSGGRFTYKAGSLLEEIYNELRIKRK